MTISIATSDICTALDATGCFGSKVTNKQNFFQVLAQSIKEHDFSADRIPGQGFIQIPEAKSFVSSGVGRPTGDPSNYVLREYRGRVAAFLKREFAAPVESCAVVVYTIEAYLVDPDVTPEEMTRITSEGPTTHVLVAVLASAGPQSQLSPYRFTANLAGGNKEAQVWTADEIRAKARDIMNYNSNWVTVADP